MNEVMNILTFSSNEDYNAGSKFINLKKLYSRNINVPKAVCVTAEFINNEVKKFIDDYDQYLKYFREIESTAGCYLLETYPKIKEMIENFSLSDEGKEIIKQSVYEAFPDYENISFAVRSSAAHEDGHKSSFAGIYKTSLFVSGLETIYNTIEEAIVEYYNYSALIARIRAEIFTEKTELNIVIQQMVDSKISGVAFSTSPISNGKPLIEWVEGIGELLVSGEETANVYYEGCDEPAYVELMNEIEKNVIRIREILGYEVDVEWCYDNDKLYIVQSRPITDSFTLNQQQGDVFEMDLLYFDTRLEYEHKLLKCEKVYQNYTSKRSPKYVIARKNDIHTGKGYVLHFNFSGLKKNIDAINKICEGQYFEKFDIDVDDTIRQNIISKETLVQYLETIFGGYDPNMLHTLIIREFISGQTGAISHLLDDGRVYIEYSSEGLLAINRGLANTDSIVVDNENVNNNALSQKCIDDIVRFTRKLNNHSYMIEWVICDNKAFFIDYSEEINGGIEDVTVNQNRVITPGNVCGSVYCIEDSEVMNKLSTSPGVSVNEMNDRLLQNVDLKSIIDTIKSFPSKPILFAEKPYAILSFLFDYVEGFVFKSGSLLCHLSILLREHKKVALISPDYDKYIHNTKEVIIANGEVLSVE